MKNALDLLGKVDDELINSIEIIPNFYHKIQDDKESVFKLLFEDDVCIFSYAMYTANHYGSLSQLIHFLSSAGRNHVVNRTYVDCTSTGKLEEALNRNIREVKQPLQILNAIEQNNILGLSFEDKSFYRLRVDLKGYYESSFKRELINIKDYL